MSLQLDHLVYCVADLDEAIVELEKLLGIRPVFGGHHQTKGTKNALLSIGGGAYLELLAVDNENCQVPAPRWMGVDLINRSKLTRWALKTTDLPGISRILSVNFEKYSRIEGGQRRKTDGRLLRWELTKPLATPEIDLIPFFLDWSRSESHPTEGLQEGVEQAGLLMSHPEPEPIRQLFAELGIVQEVSLGPVQLKLLLDSPRGHLVL